MRSRKQPEDLTFFIDRCLGRKHVPDALRKAGANVELHDDHFPQNAVDEVWLHKAGKEKWVALTEDSRIRYRELGKQAVKQSGVRLFVLVSTTIKGEQMAEAFSLALNKITRMARKNRGPFIAKVYKDGKVSLWIDLSKKPKNKRTRKK